MILSIKSAGYFLTKFILRMPDVSIKHLFYRVKIFLPDVKK